MAIPSDSAPVVDTMPSDSASFLTELDSPAFTEAKPVKSLAIDTSLINAEKVKAEKGRTRKPKFVPWATARATIVVAYWFSADDTVVLINDIDRIRSVLWFSLSPVLAFFSSKPTTPASDYESYIPDYPMASSSFKMPTPFSKRNIELEGVSYRLVADEKTGGPVKVPESMNVRKILRKVGESYNVPKNQEDCWSHFFESDKSMALLSVCFLPFCP